MKRLLRPLILVCLVFGLFAPTTARAQQEGPINSMDSGAQPEADPLPITRRVRYMTLTGFDFQPSRSDLRYYFDTGGIYPLNSVDPGPLQFNAPLYFPKDAIVKSVEFFFIYNDVTSKLNFKFTGYNPANDYSQVIMEQDTFQWPLSQHVQSMKWIGEVTIEANRAYRLQVEFGKPGMNMMLKGVQIMYTVPILGGSETCITIAGGDFIPNQADLMFRANGQAKYIVQQTTPVEGWFIAPLDLPDGSQVNTVDFFVGDSDTARDVTLYLVKKNPATEAWELLRSTMTVGSSPTIQNLSFPGSPVYTADTKLYSYLLGAALRETSTNQILFGARVCYDPPPAAQGIQTRTYMGSAFRPFSTSLSTSMYNSNLGSLYAVGNSSNIFGVNLNLPDGVMLRRAVFIVTDNTDLYDFVLAGRRFVPSLGTAADLFQEISFSFTPSFIICSITVDMPDTKDLVYDSDMDSFRLAVMMPGSAEQSLELHGARVEYYYPVFVYLPVVSR